MKLIQGGLIKTITSGDIPNGQVLIDGGKIVAVGQNLDVPAGTEIFDAAAASSRRASLTRTATSAFTRKRRAGKATTPTSIPVRLRRKSALLTASIRWTRLSETPSAAA